MKLKLVSNAAIALSLSGCSVFDPGARPQSHAQSADLSSYFEEQIEAGKRNLATNRPGQAIEAFRHASYHAHYRGEAFNGMGVAYSMLGRKDVARKLFKRAIEANPLDRRFVRNLARVNAQALSRAEYLAANATKDNFVSSPQSPNLRSDEKVASINARLAELDRERAGLAVNRSEAERLAANATEALARVRREIEAEEAQTALIDPEDETQVSVRTRASHNRQAALVIGPVVGEPDGQAPDDAGRQVQGNLDHAGTVGYRIAAKRPWFASAAIDDPRRGSEAQDDRAPMPANRTVQPSIASNKGPERSHNAGQDKRTVALAMSAAHLADLEELETRLSDATKRIDEADRRLNAIEEEVARFAARDDSMRDLLAIELAAAIETRDAAQEILETAETRIAKITERQARARDVRAELLARSESGAVGERRMAISPAEGFQSAPRELYISIAQSLNSTRNKSVFVEVLQPSGHEVLIRTGQGRSAQAISVESLPRKAGPIPVAARTTPVVRTYSYEVHLQSTVLRGSKGYRSQLPDIALLATTRFSNPDGAWRQESPAHF